MSQELEKLMRSMLFCGLVKTKVSQCLVETIFMLTASYILVNMYETSLGNILKLTKTHCIKLY